MHALTSQGLGYSFIAPARFLDARKYGGLRDENTPHSFRRMVGHGSGKVCSKLGVYGTTIKRFMTQQSIHGQLGRLVVNTTPDPLDY